MHDTCRIIESASADAEEYCESPVHCQPDIKSPRPFCNARFRRCLSSGRRNREFAETRPSRSRAFYDESIIMFLSCVSKRNGFLSTASSMISSQFLSFSSLIFLSISMLYFECKSGGVRTKKTNEFVELFTSPR